jgi:4-hydroxy-tetrahydrodipicolinate synthase
MNTTRRTFVGLGAASAAVSALGLRSAVAAGSSKSEDAGASGAASATKVLPVGPKDRFWVAAVTPCDKNYRFDEGVYRELLAWWKSKGADGILVLGTNGEGPSYSVAERKRIAEFALKNKMGLDMIVGTGTANFPETIELSRHAAVHGADSVLITPPYYFKNPSDAGLARYFTLIFDQVKTPVLYYHIPQVTGVPVDLAFFRMLAEHENFAGLKDSHGDPAEYETLANGLPARLNIISGTDNNMLAALRRGDGAILGSGNVYTKQVAAVFAAHRAGKDMTEPMRKLQAATALMEGGDYYNPSAIKYTLNEMLGSKRTSYTRPPWAEIGEDLKAKIRAGIDQLDALA